MPLLPFDEFSIEMPLTPSDAIARLEAAVEPRKFWRSGGGQRLFEGEVDASGFNISRIITYRNSFRPVIRGHVVPVGRGSRLDASLTLHPLVIAFLIVWCGLLVIIGTGMWASVFRSGTWRGDAFMPLGMLAFAWVLTSASFTFEARKARTLLSELLAGDARRSSVKAPATELAAATGRRDVQGRHRSSPP